MATSVSKSVGDAGSCNMENTKQYTSHHTLQLQVSCIRAVLKTSGNPLQGVYSNCLIWTILMPRFSQGVCKPAAPSEGFSSGLTGPKYCSADYKNQVLCLLARPVQISSTNALRSLSNPLRWRKPFSHSGSRTTVIYPHLFSRSQDLGH